LPHGEQADPGKGSVDTPNSDVELDNELIRRVAAGDNIALMALYDRCNRQAFGLAFRILGDAATAEEVVQDAFLRWLDADFRTLSFRHNNNRTANFLFADGHCETLPKSVLPNVTDDALMSAQVGKAGKGVAALKPWPHPHWRMDQR